MPRLDSSEESSSVYKDQWITLPVGSKTSLTIKWQEWFTRTSRVRVSEQTQTSIANSPQQARPHPIPLLVWVFLAVEATLSLSIVLSTISETTWRSIINESVELLKEIGKEALLLRRFIFILIIIFGQCRGWVAQPATRCGCQHMQGIGKRFDFANGSHHRQGQ